MPFEIISEEGFVGSSFTFSEKFTPLPETLFAKSPKTQAKAFVSKLFIIFCSEKLWDNVRSFNKHKLVLPKKLQRFPSCPPWSSFIFIFIFIYGYSIVCVTKKLSVQNYFCSFLRRNHVTKANLKWIKQRNYKGHKL